MNSEFRTAANFVQNLFALMMVGAIILAIESVRKIAEWVTGEDHKSETLRAVEMAEQASDTGGGSDDV